VNGPFSPVEIYFRQILFIYTVYWCCHGFLQLPDLFFMRPTRGAFFFGVKKA